VLVGGESKLGSTWDQQTTIQWTMGNSDSVAQPRPIYLVNNDAIRTSWHDDPAGSNGIYALTREARLAVDRILRLAESVKEFHIHLPNPVQMCSYRCSLPLSVF
jgi:hypothetical protein